MKIKKINVLLIAALLPHTSVFSTEDNARTPYIEMTAYEYQRQALLNISKIIKELPYFNNSSIKELPRKSQQYSMIDFDKLCEGIKKHIPPILSLFKARNDKNRDRDLALIESIQAKNEMFYSLLESKWHVFCNNIPQSIQDEESLAKLYIHAQWKEVKKGQDTGSGPKRPAFKLMYQIFDKNLTDNLKNFAENLAQTHPEQAEKISALDLEKAEKIVTNTAEETFDAYTQFFLNNTKEKIPTYIKQTAEMAPKDKYRNQLLSLSFMQVYWDAALKNKVMSIDENAKTERTFWGDFDLLMESWEKNSQNYGKNTTKTNDLVESTKKFESDACTNRELAQKNNDEKRQHNIHPSILSEIETILSKFIQLPDQLNNITIEEANKMSLSNSPELGIQDYFARKYLHEKWEEVTRSQSTESEQPLLLSRLLDAVYPQNFPGSLKAYCASLTESIPDKDKELYKNTTPEQIKNDIDKIVGNLCRRYFLVMNTKYARDLDIASDKGAIMADDFSFKIGGNELEYFKEMH